MTTHTLLSPGEASSFSSFLDEVRSDLGVKEVPLAGKDGKRDDVRSRQLQQQVDDLQKWCDTNAIISKEPLLAALRSTNALPNPTDIHEQPVASTSTLTSQPLPGLPSVRPAKRSRTTSAKARDLVKQEDEEDGLEDLTSSPTLNGSTAAGGQRLLTDAERRANHIASEQKRRAAIRDGYDQLAQTVPVLRDAMREYDARVAATSSPATRGSSGRRRKLPGAAGPLQGGIEVGGEKIDGRAGPKSEAIVLTQTVEYLKAMQVQRDDLLGRLDRARRMAQARGIDPGTPLQVWAQTYRGQRNEPEEMEK